MPPFLNTNCTHCKKPNRFDLAEIDKYNGSLIKGILFRGNEQAEELEVTCQHCGRKFKFTLDERDDGKKK
ncbi:MAG: hypothetical protein KF758_16915 [Anaerolineales bacterium]|nr:hypothetical protein [Anaerolineales bacterium]